MSVPDPNTHDVPSDEDVSNARELLAAKNFDRRSIGCDRQQMRERRLRTAERILLLRRSRVGIFGEGLFGEASWDILLSLYVAELSQYRMTITAVYNEAGVPQTTALRWLQHLVDLGMVVRRPNVVDRRAVFVELTSTTLEKMDRIIDGVLMQDT
ncbi:MarR family winged helix-turn-helix transcriptional regulator [Sphingomonas glaciei]|uniref:MarR family winged helix-turn-helix transcriptional regulator n=1 Tax=Sphingomonas glaciei TaxID=2938948 RepID=A0ABY5MWU3_9SPHN|nr:MarR family winged helix-turn-helix transcriptional regulator [Sphingomonas glaciei]UUR08919.1 MarR family winged helix-turn-helix transcriptional regulator [Sphingomonas glaciei]